MECLTDHFGHSNGMRQTIISITIWFDPQVLHIGINEQMLLELLTIWILFEDY